MRTTVTTKLTERNILNQIHANDKEIKRKTQRQWRLIE